MLSAHEPELLPPPPLLLLEHATTAARLPRIAPQTKTSRVVIEARLVAGATLERSHSRQTRSLPRTL